MTLLLLSLATFLVAYLINTTMISVFYHRGLAHRAVHWSPRVERFTQIFGIWLTGLDPKGWVCMHRMHHAFSDTERDPHSPQNLGLFGMVIGQLHAYERILRGLAREDVTFTRHVRDLPFDISWVNRRGLWLLPYAAQVAAAGLIGLALAVLSGVDLTVGSVVLGGAYFAGIMSHPLQGWMVNSLGHAVGPRNFDTPDDSRNNALAAWLIMGEGLQNNHHQYPSSARFSYRTHEPDGGWRIIGALQALGMLQVNERTLMPAFGAAPSPEETDQPQAADRQSRVPTHHNEQLPKDDGLRTRAA